MKSLSLEKQIYLCKYSEIDNIGLSTSEAKAVLNKLKEQGLYEKYKNMSEEEYERIIRKEKLMKKYEKKEKEQKQSSKEIEEEPENKLLDLNDYLFQDLKILMSDSLTEDELDRELKISKQVVSVSQTIINNANLLLQAKKHFDATKNDNSEIAPLLTLDERKK